MTNGVRINRNDFSNDKINPYKLQGRESLEQECKENHELLGELHTVRVDVTCDKSVEQARQTVEEILKKKVLFIRSRR